METGSDERVTLTVTGMTCQHCVQTVRRALLKLDGVETAQVNLSTGRVEVTGSNLNTQELAQSIKELGYGIADPEP